jgi:DNA repair ATPase RecN
MFKRFRLGRKAKEAYLSPEEIQKGIEEFEGRIPFSVLEELGDALKDKSITREQFDKIIEEVTEGVEQSRIDKKIEDMTDQLTKLSKGVETIEKLTSEKPIEEFPIERLEEIERRVDDLSTTLDKSISSTGEFEASSGKRLDKIPLLEDPTERLEKLERETLNLLSHATDLSKDLYAFFGVIDISEIITMVLKRKLPKK